MNLPNQSPEPNGIWLALESLGINDAVAAVWRRFVGDELWPALRNALLQPESEPAAVYPCPLGCGCQHEVIHHGPDDIVAVCQCEPWRCDTFPLKPDDIVQWQIGWARLGGALCHALLLDYRPAELGLSNARQIGAWSAGHVPVILTLESDRKGLEVITGQIVARLRQPFILVCPTDRPVTAPALALLPGAGAGLVVLAQHLTLLRSGVLHANIPPGELFARFTPQPQAPAGEDVARQAFALVQALGAEPGQRKAGSMTVFRLFCIEGLAVSQIARQCRCARSLVYMRLEQLRCKLGRDPAELRQYSAHLERIEASLSDPRARRIRPGAT